MSRIDEEVRPEWESMYREVVLTPVTKFSMFFPRINNLVEKRSRKLLDYDAAASKVNSEMDKPSKNTEKLPQVPNYLTHLNLA